MNEKCTGKSLCHVSCSNYLLIDSAKLNGIGDWIGFPKERIETLNKSSPGGFLRAPPPKENLMISLPEGLSKPMKREISRLMVV